MKVQVIGLGTVGLPTALLLSQYFDIVGCEINPIAKKRASERIPVKSSIIDADVYVVTVNTGITPDRKPDMSKVYDVCEKISKINANALVLIESTVSVGTCRSVSGKFGLKRLAHCPHRYWSVDPIKYGVVQTRVLGALNKESLDDATHFYSKIGVPLYVVPSLEVAELSKIAENAHRFVEIAFAESLAMVCKKLGISFEEVRKACNTLKRVEYGYQVNILEARCGIQGECLPKDIRYLLFLHDSPLLEGAIKTDAQYMKSDL
ncbi:MAG: hypothetical protein N3A69_08500 [Leptospiraceae bacterium]|nr:hypothetical protein [Leptospiraceae bacterium]